VIIEITVRDVDLLHKLIGNSLSRKFFPTVLAYYEIKQHSGNLLDFQD
jgi:hypothetical protein